MKQWFELMFYIPKHAKPTDENIMKLIMPSVVGIVLCMACLAGSTWAWFTASVQTPPQVIAAANFNIDVNITDESEKKIMPSEPLEEGKEYTVALTAKGTAEEFGGYCKISLPDSAGVLYTGQIEIGETLEFTLIPDKTGVYAFTGVWGKYKDEPDVKNGGTIAEKKPESPEPSTSAPQEQSTDIGDKPSVPENTGEVAATEKELTTEAPTDAVYTVQAGDTLSEIAAKYSLSAEALARYNKIEPAAPLRQGQLLKIPAEKSATENNADAA